MEMRSPSWRMFPMTETPETQTYESMIAELKAIAKQLDDPETPIE